MEPDWLTVRLVEQLQERIEDGEEIDSIVATLQGATLPGFVEYRCFRRAKGIPIPHLPTIVTSSPIGKAFAALSATNRPALRRMDSQPVEFYVIRVEGELLDENWEAFTIRFARSAYGAGLDKTVAGGLRGALKEMADNAVLHSQTDAPVLVGYRVLPGFAQFCVSDVGVGVLDSLRGCPDFAYLRFANEAIKEALRDGVSRFGRNRGGMGFREIFKALAEQWGVLRFRSGEGCITMDGTSLDADHSREEFLPRLPGFQVTVSCRSDSALPPEPLL